MSFDAYQYPLSSDVRGFAKMETSKLVSMASDILEFVREDRIHQVKAKKALRKKYTRIRYRY